jgi:cytochrome c biogenesis protein CcmG, thiol:disulfide interchange protein DsbE
MVPIDELEPSTRPRPPRRTVAIALALVAVAGAVAHGVLRPAPPSPTGEGRDVPEFTLERLDGKGTISSDDLRGKPVILNFWASWCEPCKEELPLFQQAWEDYADRGVTVLGVNLRDARANAKAFVGKHDVTYPVVVDDDETLARALDVGGLPETFFIAPDWSFQAVGEGSGTVVLGAVSEKLLNDEIQELLAATR